MNKNIFLVEDYIAPKKRKRYTIVTYTKPEPLPGLHKYKIPRTTYGKKIKK